MNSTESENEQPIETIPSGLLSHARHDETTTTEKVDKRKK